MPPPRWSDRCLRAVRAVVGDDTLGLRAHSVLIRLARLGGPAERIGFAQTVGVARSVGLARSAVFMQSVELAHGGLNPGLDRVGAVAQTRAALQSGVPAHVCGEL